MKWFKNNTAELMLGLGLTIFLINFFTTQGKNEYFVSIPLVVLGSLVLYKRHFIPVKIPQQIANENSFFNNLDEDGEDDLYEDAKEAVLEGGKASTSYIQRRLRVGYSRAVRLMDMLEDKGVIGPADGSKPREVIKEK